MDSSKMKGMDSKQIIILTSPVVVALLCIIALSHVKLKPALSLEEQRLSDFSQEKLQVIHRQRIEVSAIDSPIRVEALAQKVGYPQVPLEKVAPLETDVEIKVSFILINGGRKMAIINGLVVREGDTVSQSRVAKIERNRILIKDKKGERWIGID